MAFGLAPWAYPYPQPTGPEVGHFGEGLWMSPGYRNAVLRVRWCVIFFVAVALIGLGVAGMGLRGLELVAQAQTGEQYLGWLTAYDWIESFDTAMAWLVFAWLALVVCLAFWINRAVDNLPPLAGGIPSRSPNYSAGWWFVPFACIALPYLVLREAWGRYATQARQGKSFVVGVWWLAVIAANVLWFLAIAIEYEAPIAQGSRPGMIAAVALGPLAIIVAGLGIYMVREIQARAEERARTLGLDRPLVPWAPGANAWAPGGAVMPMPQGQWPAPQGQWPPQGQWAAPQTPWVAPQGQWVAPPSPWVAPPPPAPWGGVPGQWPAPPQGQWPAPQGPWQPAQPQWPAQGQWHAPVPPVPPAPPAPESTVAPDASATPTPPQPDVPVEPGLAPSVEANPFESKPAAATAGACRRCGAWHEAGKTVCDSCGDSLA